MEKSSTDRPGAEPCRVEVVREKCISEQRIVDRFRSRLHPEDRESVLNAVENSLRTGAEYRSEYRVVLPNGRLHWIAGRGHVECNGDGQPVRMRGVMDKLLSQ